MTSALNESTEIRFECHGVLGTVIEFAVGITDPDPATERWLGDEFDVLVDEVERLESVFSAFDHDSELSRWRLGQPGRWSEPFTTLMADAAAWQEATGGAFNPASGAVTDLWRRAEETGVEPSAEAVVAVATSITGPVFEIDGDGRPVLIDGPCPWFNLNALAKGFIVDRAVGLTWDRVMGRAGDRVRRMTVSAGGDLVHRGPDPVRIGLENPVRPYDNEPPVQTLELSNQAIASSGGGRRRFRIGGRHYSHLVDPASGYPVDHPDCPRSGDAPAGVSVIAPDAATADVVATAISIDPSLADSRAFVRYRPTSGSITYKSWVRGRW